MSSNFLHSLWQRLKNVFTGRDTAVGSLQAKNTANIAEHDDILPGITSTSRPPKPSAKWTEQEISDFSSKLNQVVGWTQKLAQGFDYTDGFYGTVFRQTNPVIDGVALYHLDGDYATWQLDHVDHNLYPVLLEKAIEARDNQYNINNSILFEQGRILIVETCLSTCDGAAIVDSQCFVDESDLPPIDTWFYIRKNHYNHGPIMRNDALFCWIPTTFIPVMENAIQVEIMDSYEWLNEADPRLYRKIQSEFSKSTSNH